MVGYKSNAIIDNIRKLTKSIAAAYVLGLFIELIPYASYGPTGWYYYNEKSNRAEFLYIYCGCTPIIHYIR